MPTKTSSSHRSIKHDIIDRDNTRIVAIVAIAVFLVVFCGFAMKTLFSQSLYHNRVISEKEKTRDQLKQNKEALADLKDSYDAFVAESENLLGGSPDGNGPLDGNNGKLVLDALPGTYDFPALSSSFEKILVDGGYDVGSIGGTEDVSAITEATAEVKPIEIPYMFTFTATLSNTKDLIRTLERSIRPMHVDGLGITVGENGDLTTSVTLHTYYTQQKTFELGSKEVE